MMPSPAGERQMLPRQINKTVCLPFFVINSLLKFLLEFVNICKYAPYAQQSMLHPLQLSSTRPAKLAKSPDPRATFSLGCSVFFS